MLFADLIELSPGTRVRFVDRAAGAERLGVDLQVGTILKRVIGYAYTVRWDAGGENNVWRDCLEILAPAAG